MPIRLARRPDTPKAVSPGTKAGSTSFNAPAATKTKDRETRSRTTMADTKALDSIPTVHRRSAGACGRVNGACPLRQAKESSIKPHSWMSIP